MENLMSAEAIDIQSCADIQGYFEDSQSALALLLWMAEYFHHKAHEGSTTSIEHAKLVRVSIQASLMLLKEHLLLLTPLLELQICLRLTHLYLDETENLSTAEEYAQRAMSIALRARLARQKFAAELLIARVFQASLSNMYPKFLSSKIDEYLDSGEVAIAGTFQLMLGQLQFTNDTSLYILEQLSQNKRIDAALRALSLLYQCGHQLHAESPSKALDLLKEVSILGLGSLPVQIHAMYLLQKHIVSIQCNLRKEGKEVMVEISNFIQAQLEEQWQKWSVDGGFDVALDTERLYRVTWLNPDEFVLLFYILTAISLMNEGNGKADVVFERCHAIINGQSRMLDLKMLEFGPRGATLDELTLRRSYLSFLVTAYEIVLVLHRDESDAEAKIEALASHNFKDDPFHYYLQGLFCHKQKNFVKAKEFYLKARECKPSAFYNSFNSHMPISNSQHGEISVFSTLQLLLIIEGEEESSRDSEWHRLRQQVQLDLDNAIASHSESSRMIGTTLAAIVFKLINAVYEDLDLPGELLVFAGKNGKNTPFLAGLIYYVSIVRSTNLDLRRELQLKLVKLSQKLGDGCSQGRFIRGLVLKEQLREGIESADLLRMQIRELEGSEQAM